MYVMCLMAAEADMLNMEKYPLFLKQEGVFQVFGIEVLFGKL